MRILHVTDAASAGVLTAVTTLARAQAAHPDIERVVLGYVPRPDSPTPAGIAELTGPAVEVRRWHRGGRTAIAGLTGRLWSTLGREGFDIVHLHSSRAGFLGRPVAALRGHRDRTVYSPHCFAFDRSDFGAGPRAVYRALERIGARAGDRLVLVSESEAEVARRAIPGVRTAVLRNSVDVAALQRTVGRTPGETAEVPAPAADRNGEDGPPLVVHIGRIQGQKQPEQFAAVARRVRAALGPVRFRWLGDGDRARLGDGIEVSGWMPHAVLVAELARADAVLFTSAGEGMPMSVLEAQTLGVPVIASDVTGLRDIVDDGVTGRLVTGEAALVAALIEVLSDPALRSRLGSAAAARARAAFDSADLADRSLNAYRSLAAGERTP